METGTIEQTMSVAEGATAINIGQLGAVSGGLQVGQISNYRIVAESHFYELNLEKLEADPSIIPPRADELALFLEENRLLILAGDLEDKSDCARQVAVRLLRRLEAQGRSAVLRERCRGKDPQRIETAFLEDKISILLLTEISQSLIAGYSPASLQNLLAERGGYAILTTDCTREQWEIHEGSKEAQLWKDLTLETYYGRDLLARHLERLIFNTGLAIPAGLVNEDAEGELRVGDVPLRDAVARLKTPGRIQTFVHALTDGTVEPSPEGVAAKLVELSGDATAIRHWYLQFNDRDQLLVLGLVLLDGLPDDLLFAGLEILVESIWRETDPLFCQFDYRDLARFAAYFKLTPSDGGFLRIETGSRRRRSDILQVAWSHQRRRLLAALPALVEMIRVSASEPRAASASAARLAAERALSRTKSGSMQLHQTLVESLSLIGLLSVDVVEPYLLDLAAGTSESVQLLIAQALAVWREAGRESEFFALLRRWWAEACDVGNPDSEIARANGLAEDPWAAVRAAIALTVSYAAQYDRENRLAPELSGLLSVLIDDPHPQVKSAVWRHTVPRVVAWHFRQLVPFLRQRVLASQDFAEAVARGAAEACEMRPDECLPIVARWWEEARIDPARSGRLEPGRREILLGTVAQTFGHIRSSAESEPLSVEQITTNLSTILEEERHRFVRWHALQGVMRQTQAEPVIAAQVLPALLGRLQIEDRAQVVAMAVRVYLHQRQNLEGGDRKLEIDGKTYAVWTTVDRPVTPVEATMYSWLADSSRPVAQQVAVAVFAAFTATTLEQEERRLRGSRSEGAAATASAARETEFKAQLHDLNLFGRLSVTLATPGRKELRPLLYPVMAEVVVFLRQRLARLADWRRQAARLRPRSRKAKAAPEASSEAAGSALSEGTEPVETILRRWAGQQEESAQTISRYLLRAVQFYRLRWAVVFAFCLLAYGTGRLLVRASHQLDRPIAILAEQTVPSPTVALDLYAPLAPGLRPGVSQRWPWVLQAVPLSLEQSRLWGAHDGYNPFRVPLFSRLPAGVTPKPDEETPFWPVERGEGWARSDEDVQLWVRPRPYALVDLAAPLPPGVAFGSSAVRKMRDAEAPPADPAVKDIAWNWRKRIYLTR